MSAGKSLQKLEEYVVADPNLIMTVCDNIVNGSSLTEVAKTWGIRYSDLYKWVVADEERHELYKRALDQKKDYLSSRIIDELKYIGLADLRKVYDEEGNVKPMSQWPDDIAAAVGSIKKTMDGVEIKVNDKLKALQMMGQEMAMFSTKVEHSGKVSLEALIASSMPPELRSDTVETIDVTPEEETDSEPASEPEEEKNEPEPIAVGEEHPDMAF